MFELTIPKSLNTVLDAIDRAGGRPLIVGGAVRDAALGLELADPKDFDVEVYGLDAEELIQALGSVSRVNAVGKSFGVLKVMVDGVEVDVSLPRRESKRGRGHRGFLIDPDPGMTPEDAAARRDFTINAMAFDPRSGDLLDFHGGLQDLRDRVLRHVGPTFADDPLRVLRGMQMAGRFGLRAADDTVELSRGLFDEYDTLAVERVWTEWHKWAGRSMRPSLGLKYLADCGWWQAYPQLQALEPCPQDPEWHPEGNVWVHTLLVTDAAAAIAERDRLVGDERAVLVLTALSHDLGKPETTVLKDGRYRSPGHAGCEDTVRGFLSNVGCPARLADRVVGLTRHHLAHMNYVGSPRHVRRLARSLGEHGETIEMLGRVVEADHSGRPPLPGGLPEKMQEMLEAARDLAMADAAPTPLLQGRHLIEMGVTPGPEMGRILHAAYEAQLDGAFATVDEARRWFAEKIG